MSNTDKFGKFDAPEFPVRVIRCALVIESVEIVKAKKATKTKDAVVGSKRVTGYFKMETMKDFDFWFSFSDSFRMPTLGKLEQNEKISSGVKAAAKRRIRAALGTLGEAAEGISKVETGKWHMVKVEEENFFND